MSNGQETTPTTQAPKSVADAIAEAMNRAGGFNSVPVGAVSKSSRSAIGVTGTKTYDPMTGRPTGYYGYQTKQMLPQTSGFEPGGQVVTENPKYFSGDEDMLNKFSPEDIATIQQSLSFNGLLGRKYTPGIVDNSTRSAFRELLGIANRQTTDWQTTLGTISQVKSQGSSIGTYSVSNPDDLKAVFRKAAQDMLGRNLGDGDINSLVETFQAREKQQAVQSASGGKIIQAPSPQTFAQQQIAKDFGEEVDVRKMDNIFSAIDQALSGGKK